MVSWSDDHTLRLWDDRDGTQVAVLEGHTERVDEARLLSNGRLLSRSSRDHTLRLWDANTGELHGVLQGHEGMVHGALQLDDDRILTWTGDKTLRLWDSETGEALGVWATGVAARVAPELWAAYCSRKADGDAATWFLAESSGAVMHAVLADQRTVVWHGDGILFACSHMVDGVVVACCGKDLIIAQLYQGDRRLTGPTEP